MNDPLFFGYGSLVNRATHTYMHGRHARLTGWRRQWRHTQFRETAFLTVVPWPGCVIEGLVAQVPGGDFSALDLREAGYDRIDSDHVDVGDQRLASVAVYSIPDNAHAAPAAIRPILLSYLDVVVQGYHREFGNDGVARFFQTTDGWDAPILNDRAHPTYARHQYLTAEETELVDYHLSARGAKVRAA